MDKINNELKDILEDLKKLWNKCPDAQQRSKIKAAMNNIEVTINAPLGIIKFTKFKLNYVDDFIRSGTVENMIRSNSSVSMNSLKIPFTNFAIPEEIMRNFRYVH